MLRALFPRTRLDWVERLAGLGMWIAIGVSVSAPSRWTWVSSGCVLALAVVSAAAGIPRRRAGRRLVLRQTGDRDGALGGEVGGPADAMHWRHTLTGVSRLMPASAGRRWLAEAQSVLAEVAADRRGATVRGYLLSAPRLMVMVWAREVQRRVRPGPRRPG